MNLKSKIQKYINRIIVPYPSLDVSEFNKVNEDMATFYNALRNLLLELKALDDDRIKALFEKYDVIVS